MSLHPVYLARVVSRRMLDALVSVCWRWARWQATDTAVLSNCSTLGSEDSPQVPA